MEVGRNHICLKSKKEQLRFHAFRSAAHEGPGCGFKVDVYAMLPGLLKLSTEVCDLSAGRQ